MVSTGKKFEVSSESASIDNALEASRIIGKVQDDVLSDGRAHQPGLLRTESDA